MATVNKNLSDFSETRIPSASGYRFGIVAAEWNAAVTGKLLDGAVKTLHKYGAPEEAVTVIQVPGSFELTAGAGLLAGTAAFDAIICLGCVIKGETPHFDYICQAVAQGLTQVSVKYNLPVIFGVLTTFDQAQALDRAGGKHGNKGDEAAVTAIKMAALFKK